MIGQRLGSYEITAKLGEGGMGEVYRATDTKLKREVAIKVLPAAFTEDKERLARFEREAQVLAQLHHPNIASIFGLEESEGIRALVLELVEGPTLAERIEQGPLPFNECLSISLQIAHALEEAHEKGIVHRDLKPQNIKASIEGRVKVLDFGLAKAMDPASSSSVGSTQLAASPTMTLGATQMGMILGTAAYMSPEQAKGFPVDKRADIWAFGVVLFEMLSGRSLFTGDSVPDTLARVLQRDVDFNALPESIPAAIRSLLKRCLERNPKNRLRDIGDARLALEEALAAPAGRSEPGAVAAPAPPARERLRFLPWAIAAVAVAVAGWSTWRSTGASPRGGESEAEPIRLEVSLPTGVEPVAGIAGGFGISPDGRAVAMIGVREGLRRLYVRRLDRSDVLEVDASAGANAIAFSPDSSRIVFVPGNAQVTSLSLVDQQRTTVATGADLGSTVAWGESGIYYLREGALWTVSPEGSAARQLTQLDPARHEVLHSDPVEIPGSHRVLFSDLSSQDEVPRIESVSLVDGSRKVVIDRATTPVWSSLGYLLFEREGSVWAVALDRERTTVSGAAVLVVRAGEIGALRYGSLGFRLSASGTLFFMPPDYDAKRIVSVLTGGVEQALDLEPGAYANPRVSPDGKRLLIERGTSVLEVLDLERGTRTQLTSPAIGTSFSTWTSDGQQVVLRRFNLPHWVAADGSGRSGSVPEGSINDYPSAPGPEPGSFLLVRIQAQSSGDVLLASLTGAFPPKPLVQTPAYEGGPQLSPDGEWLIYQSNASGRPEVYVRRYPALDRAWQVSESGGVQTRWAADGSAIYFRGGHSMASASFDGRGAEPILGKPVDLFEDEFDFGQGLSVSNYDVTKDGHFLMLRRTPSGGRLHLVLNWGGELKRLLASGGLR